jgi:hypothetical protein
MLLRALAHVRTGDKGDVLQISIIAYDPADYDLLVREVTVERVCAHLGKLEVMVAQRHELPSIGALSFVLKGALSGGVTRSLCLDAHGKTLGAQLLDLIVEA